MEMTIRMNATLIRRCKGTFKDFAGDEGLGLRIMHVQYGICTGNLSYISKGLANI